jgi:hypothetical protein
MKMTCSLVSSAQCIHGQDLSKYQNFSFGMRLVELAKQVDPKTDRGQLDPTAPRGDSRVAVVATARFRDSSNGACPADSLLLQQWRALQDFGDL